MNNTEPIFEHGLFWLRDSDEKKLWGTLHINEANEFTLETFGSLTEPNEGGRHTIVGRVNLGQRWVTLIDCFPTNTRNSMMRLSEEIDWSRQTYFVDRVVDGIGFEKGEDIVFEQAIFGISSLPKWANPCVVKLERTKGSIRPSRVNISIEDRADEIVNVKFRGEEVKISLRFVPKQKGERRGVITRFFIEDCCYLIVERSDGSKMQLRSTLSVARAMQDFLSIVCNETSTVTSIDAYHERGEALPAKVYVRMLGDDVEEKKEHNYPALNLKDLGGIGVVARWIEVWERYGDAAARLTSNWYKNKAFGEDKFFRMYTAVEGLLSRRKGRSKATMRADELAEFVVETMPSFSSLTGKLPKDWAEAVKEMRNQRVSHSDPTNTLKDFGTKMLVMTNVLYLAGASFLLREIGVRDHMVAEYTQECSKSLMLSEMQ